MARLLLGVTGSIAAYKALELVREATLRGHSVRVLQTPSSLRFVGKASFEALTGAPVLVDEFESDPARGAFPGDPAPEVDPLPHLALVDRADVYAVAPASANTLAKMASGQADGMVTAAFLACERPVIVAPAMNDRMWANAATCHNVSRLRERGVIVVEPETGRLASSGEQGTGRLAGTPRLIEAIERSLSEDEPAAAMSGVRVLVTAGGTREPVDSVRFLGNRSSGRMGFALAEEAAIRGAQVTVVAANVGLPRRSGIEYVDVETTAELAEAAKERFPGCDVLLMAAAPADFRPRETIDGKTARETGDMSLDLVATEDILAGLASRRRPGQFLVGFAAEHGPCGVDRARKKLARKGVDALVVNDISRSDIGFDAVDNEVTIVERDEVHRVSKRAKRELSKSILDRVRERTDRV